MSRFNEKWKRLIEVLNEKRDDFEVPILLEILATNRIRIHTDGLDTYGNKIGVKGKYKGRYSPSYESWKRKIAFNLYPINLFLDGDLSRAMEYGKVDGENVLLLNPNITYGSQGKEITSGELAQHFEDIYNTSIWQPTPKQINDAFEKVGSRIITNHLRECAIEAGFEFE